jgi:diaminohydroxyphosphoribosylaminopyrimidine deaminase/5-amino-6-(5-phosphoribosylamino)uracil reductase
MNDSEYIRKTFELARQGAGFVSPNPLVGAVLVKNNKIIGQGFHQQYGHNHAEINAIESSTETIEGATLYCNLEPCCHTNKQTPPCAQRIIKEKIVRVVVCNKDPNSNVNGKGLLLLKDASIEVIQGVLEQEGKRLNEIFFTYHEKQRPFIHIKYAQTLDGNIASLTGDSKWISNEKSRQNAHQLRVENDAIVVGVKTIFADNPALTIRLVDSKKKCPWRIILGSIGAIELTHEVLFDQYKQKTILVTSEQDYSRFIEKAVMLSEHGITVLPVSADDSGKINLHKMCQTLMDFKITSLLIEGGSETITSFVRAGLCDRVSIFIAPKILGTGLNAIGPLNIDSILNAHEFHDISYQIIEDNILFSARPKMR